ncbi:MAG: hypothetical protein Q4F21_07020 [Lachnospiraceae bacterium]|nr:hypothetical protein [Lachnospiraceae bacterium]
MKQNDTNDTSRQTSCTRQKNSVRSDAKTKSDKTDILMDALNDIEPKYIEEAHQAFSTASKRSNRLRHFIHSPVTRLTAAACLVLLIAVGGSKAEILPDFTSYFPFSSEKSAEKSSKGNSSKVSSLQGTIPSDSSVNHAGQAPADKNTPLPEIASENQGCYLVLSSESTVTKSNDASYALLTEPPELTITASKASADQQIIQAVKNKSSWSYIKKDGTTAASVNQKRFSVKNSTGLPSCSTDGKEAVVMNFGAVSPDTLSLRCWQISGRKVLEQTEQKLYPDQNQKFQLPQKKMSNAETSSEEISNAEVSYIIEITAAWDQAEYSGECIYGFKITY